MQIVCDNHYMLCLALTFGTIYAIKRLHQRANWFTNLLVGEADNRFLFIYQRLNYTFLLKATDHIFHFTPRRCINNSVNYTLCDSLSCCFNYK